MVKICSDRLRWASVALVALFAAASPAESRIWSRNPVNLAMDYAIITDNRGGGDIVEVFWMAPQLIPAEAPNKSAAELLDKYVVIGVVHAHFAKDGTATFDPVATLDASDASGQPLNALNEATMPPAVVGALATLQSVFGRSLGPLGQGVHWFAFDSGAAHACAKGGMSVQFAGDKYTYDTPIPGCP